MKTLFVTGMFRSGTTLIGRVLHAHRNVGLASDGLFPLFKHLRSAAAANAGIEGEFPFHAPFPDYAFGTNKDLLEAIRNASLDLAIDEDERGILLDRVARWCTGNSQYAPLLHPHVGNCLGGSYKELLNSLIGTIKKVYGGNSSEVTAFKEVWTTEFIWPLAKTFPEMRFICVLRDPRAVFASKKHRETMYPPLFLARQWRKLAALALLASSSPDFGDRVLIVRFEDLITDPVKTTRSVCNFLDLAWEATMTKPNEFVDGVGAPWRQNTAYGTGKNTFAPEAATNWQKTLTSSEIGFVEALCWPEAEACGYEATGSWGLDPLADVICNPPTLDPNSLAPWIRPFVNISPLDTAMELTKEFLRAVIFDAKAPHPEQLVESCFLDRTVFEQCKIHRTQGAPS